MIPGNEVTGYNIFYSLRTYFLQGGGFGTLLSLLHMIKDMSIHEGGFYRVPEELMEMLMENGTIAYRIIELFQELDWLYSNELPTERVECTRLISLLKEAEANAKLYSAIGNHNLKFNVENENQANIKSVAISSQFLYKAIYELMINGLKFSKENTEVKANLQFFPSIIIIKISSIPKIDSMAKFQGDFLKFAFEPFFRLSNNLYESYNTPDYGLGLTLVHKVIQKHSGTITVNTHDKPEMGTNSKEVVFTIALNYA